MFALTNILLAEVILRRQVPECGLLGVLNSHRLDASQQHVLGNLAAQSVQPGHQHLISSATNSAIGGARSVLRPPESRLRYPRTRATRAFAKNVRFKAYGSDEAAERSRRRDSHSKTGWRVRRPRPAPQSCASGGLCPFPDFAAHRLVTGAAAGAQGDTRARHRAHPRAVARTTAAGNREPGTGKSLPSQSTYRIHQHRIGHPTYLTACWACSPDAMSCRGKFVGTLTEKPTVEGGERQGGVEGREGEREQEERGSGGRARSPPAGPRGWTRWGTAGARASR